MKLDIHSYGDPILRTPAERIPAVTPEIRTLAADMIETMRAAEGVGLAAQQIGRALAICTVEVPAEYDTDEAGTRKHPDLAMPMVLLNPEITASARKLDHHEEGCLSFPGVRGDIQRPVEITLRYQDLDGQVHERVLRDFLARVVQHEVDHLNGVLFIDRMSAPKRLVLAKRLKRMRLETEERLGLG